MNWSHRFVRKEDRAKINTHVGKMMRESTDRLISRFNREKKYSEKHNHLLYLLALDWVFRRRFMKSPTSLSFNDFGNPGGLAQSIIQIGDSWEFLPSEN